MNKAILNSDVQRFINENLNSDLPVLSLSKSPFASVSPGELAEQIDSKKRCENKLPLWFRSEGIYYPPKLAIEQASSEMAARYKADLISGDHIIDLTGGFGVDTYCFALKAKQVTHCELNKELSEISEYNSGILGARINYLNMDGMKYLRSAKETFSTIYIDPSRRVDSRKVFKLRDCEPDVSANLQVLLEHSSRILIKTAPLLDIQSTLNELKQVSEVHIISIRNDCKELLYLIDRQFTGNEPLITCALLAEDKGLRYSFKLSEEKAFRIEVYSEPLAFIYEPDVALLKAGCFKLITRDFGLKKIHQHTHLYTSETLSKSFPGRKFKLIQAWNYGRFVKENQIKKSNIICRNFPLGPEDLKKKLKIRDGGTEYLLFCTGRNKELMVLNCERIP